MRLTKIKLFNFRCFAKKLRTNWESEWSAKQALFSGLPRRGILPQKVAKIDKIRACSSAGRAFSSHP